MNVELKRQMVHASGILLILVLQIFGRVSSIILFSMGVLFFLFWGYLRKSGIKVRGLSAISDFFMTELKTYERDGEYFKGPVAYMIGMLLSIVLFPLNIATACIAVLAAGDSFSTLVGKLYGKHSLPINHKKTWEGSMAFFSITYLILWFFDPVNSLLFALVTTFVEMLPRIDDNITIPLCVGILFSVL